MAQTTIAEIKKQMTDAFIGNTVIASVYGLTPGLSFEDEFSAVSIESIIFDIVAFFLFTLQNLFSYHKDEVKGIIAAEKPHRAPWYATMALRFQYGHNLVYEQDYYDNTGLADSVIEAAKVVKHATAEEVKNGLRIKTAKIVGDDLAALSAPQLTALRAYFKRIKDAGVNLTIDSADADSLKLHLRIYYNALILDATGARLDGSGPPPVPDAIDSFLKSTIEFNRLFVVSELVARLKSVEGVVIPYVISAQARYGMLPYTDVPVEYLADAGYLRILAPTDLIIDYVPHEPL